MRYNRDVSEVTELKLYYIGTGAADWTKENGARDGVTRRFTATLVNDDLMIDLAWTTPLSYFERDSVCAGVKYIIYTHSHNDHYDRDILLALLDTRALTVLCHADFAARLPAHGNLTVIPLEPGEEVAVGRYKILPLRANHRVASHPSEQPLHYVIASEGKKIFWGADGAWLYCDTWQALLKQAPFDRMVLDGTLGEGEGDWRIFEHNNLPMIRLMQATIVKKGMLGEAGQLWIAHLSRDAHESPVTLPTTLEKEQIFVANDDIKDEF